MNKLTQMAQQRAAVQPPQPQQGAQTFLQRAAQSSEEQGESKKMDTKAEEKGESKQSRKKSLDDHLEEASKIEGRFNGNVTYKGETVKVRGGFATYGDEIFMISNDGRLVVNKDGHIAGVIQEGEVKELTPEILDQLKQEGLVGDGKPQGTTPQAPQ